MKHRLAGLALLLALSAVPALGQCALCYESASAASQKGQKAITRAIEVLLIPTLGLMAGLVTIAVRYKGVAERDDAAHENESVPGSGR